MKKHYVDEEPKNKTELSVENEKDQKSWSKPSFDEFRFSGCMLNGASAS